MRKHLSLCASFALAVLTGPVLAHEDYGIISPRSTHDHVQLHDLINGKILIARAHGLDSIRSTGSDAVRVNLYATDGTAYGCTFGIDDDGDLTGYGYNNHEKWLTEPHPKRLSRLRFLAPGDDPTSNNATTSMQYEPETGRISNRLYYKGRYYIGIDGHLQTSIPAVVYELCPSFPAPETLGLPLNTKQTSRHYSKLLAQDPDAPIRNFFTVPQAPAGANSASTAAPSSPEAAEDAAFSLREPAASFVARTDGQFITDERGRFYTFVPLTSQLLEIEGEEKVIRYANVSYLKGSPNTYQVSWSDGQTDLWPADKPLPFAPTGIESRIGSFFAWLHGRPLDAEIAGFVTDRIEFAKENVLFVRGNGPAQHFARGDTIVIQLRDGPARAFHWTELAADLGWKGFP